MLAQWLKKLGCIFIWCGKPRSVAEIPQGIDESMRQGVIPLFWFNFVVGYVIGILILIRQFYPDSGYLIPSSLTYLYLGTLLGFGMINQIDLWSTNHKQFRRGELIFYFWLLIVVTSVFGHFFSKGRYAFAERELLEIIIGNSGIFTITKISSGIRKNVLEKKNGNGNGNGNGHKNGLETPPQK